MTGIGKIDIGMQVPGIQFDSYGKIEYNLGTKQTTMNVSGPLVFDHFFTKHPWKKLLIESIIKDHYLKLELSSNLNPWAIG